MGANECEPCRSEQRTAAKNVAAKNVVAGGWNLCNFDPISLNNKE